MRSDLGRTGLGVHRGFSNSGQGGLLSEMTLKQAPEGSERVCRKAEVWGWNMTGRLSVYKSPS